MSFLRCHRYRVALLALGMVGCAHRGAYRVPGPLVALGSEVEQSDDSGVVDADVAEPAETQARATPPVRESGRSARRSARATAVGKDVANAAGSFVGKQRLRVDGESYRYDCSGFVCAAYAKADVPVDGNSKALYRMARSAGVLHKRKTPQVGDIAFFDNTYDRDGNGRRDDSLTHVAIVESVDADGTAVLVHVGSKGVKRLAINLRDPSSHQDSAGNEINSYLRSGRSDGGPRLAGELFVAWGSLWAAPQDATADAR